MTCDRPLEKYVKPVRRGRRVHLYFRYRGTYLRLPQDRTSAEYHEAYAAALKAIHLPSAKTHAPGSVQAMIAEYKDAPEFRALRPKTQRDYAKALDHLGLAVGRFPANAIARADIVRLRNKIAKRGTRAADLWISVVARCFHIGMDLGYVDQNPAAKIDRINVADSYLSWPASARALFETSNPPPHLMRAYMIALWTSLRLGDVLSLVRTRYDGTGFVIHHTKSDRLSGVERPHYIPAAAPLRAYLATEPAQHVLFVTGPDGRRISERVFSQEFRAWIDRLGLTPYHFHGLRVTTATALAEAGATGNQIAAITGHQSSQMVDHYTRGARQKKLAIAAINKLDNGNGNGT